MTTNVYCRDCQIEELRAELRTSVEPMEAREIEAELKALLMIRDSQAERDRDSV